MDFTPFDFNNNGSLDPIENGALYNYIENEDDFSNNNNGYLLTTEQYKERRKKAKKTNKATAIFSILFFCVNFLYFFVMIKCKSYFNPLNNTDNLIFILLAVTMLTLYLAFLIIGRKYVAQISKEGYTLKQFLKKTFHIGKE